MIEFRDRRAAEVGMEPIVHLNEDELRRARSSEHQGRAIDRDRAGYMELKKQEGHF